MKLVAMAAIALASLVGADIGAGAAVAQTTVSRTTVVRHGPGYHHRRTKVCRIERHGHRRIRRCFWR